MPKTVCLEVDTLHYFSFISFLSFKWFVDVNNIKSQHVIKCILIWRITCFVSCSSIFKIKNIFLSVSLNFFWWNQIPWSTSEKLKRKIYSISNLKYRQGKTLNEKYIPISIVISRTNESILKCSLPRKFN
jgi:hypothetical protein